MRTLKERHTLVAYAAALIFAGCTSTSTSTVQTTLSNQHLYVATGSKVFVYNLPLTNSSVPAVTLLTPGYGANPCLDSAGHIFMEMNIVTGTTSSFVTQAFALPLTATSAPVFVLSTPDGPADCHFDPSGNMYVANNSSVQVFKSPVQSGSAINSTITASVVSSSGLWTDSPGRVYVSNGVNILVYSSFATGNVLQATFGSSNGGGLALGPSGSLYVANGTSAGQIDVYDPPFTNTSTRNASKTIKVIPNATLGDSLTYLAFDNAGDMFVGACVGCIPTGSWHIYMLQPPYTSVNVDLNLGLTHGIGLTVGP